MNHFWGWFWSAQPKPLALGMLLGQDCPDVCHIPQPGSFSYQREMQPPALTSFGSPLKHHPLQRSLLWCTCLFLPISFPPLLFHIMLIKSQMYYINGFCCCCCCCFNLFLSLEYKLHERNNFVLCKVAQILRDVLTDGDKVLLIDGCMNKLMKTGPN